MRNLMQLCGRKDSEINVDRNVYAGVRWYRTHISWIRWIRNPECTRRECDLIRIMQMTRHSTFNWLNTIPAIPQMRLRFIICIAVPPNVNYRERKAHLRAIYFPSLSAVNVSYILRYRFVLEEKKKISFKISDIKRKPFTFGRNALAFSFHPAQDTIYLIYG